MTINNTCNPGEVKVSGIGETSIFPDSCVLGFTIHASKATYELAEISVKKRAEYARQEIHNVHFEFIQISEHRDVRPCDRGYEATWGFEVTCRSIEKANRLALYLKSKLSSYFDVTSYVFFISEQKLAECRKQAITQAVADAKRKAELIASAFGQRIRGLVTVVESETTVKPVSENGEEPNVERTKLSGWGPAIRSAQRRICVRLDVTCALDNFSR
ncbi:hypothetical protein P879_00106 [Paragonimus westermani]|uniref:SIMPL domain-containing protein n=1 Tax=Paragonimus westermani TaxID=34504 RepID=A0A8T0DTW4_9TREM|nr:hypothetical protein P879_00106 [Paragonimus westermani]